MSTDRIRQLHDQASELYLSGDYQGALQAWRDVLGLDPADEQALGGLRLALQFVEHDAPAFAGMAGQVEHELDQGLKVLDVLGGTTLIVPDMGNETIDRMPEPEGYHELARDEILDGWEAPQVSSADEGSYGLEAMSEPQEHEEPVSAAAAELSRRVDDLLGEAKAKAEAGERDDALAILARLSILDEDNAAAAILRSKIEFEGASDLDKVERAIIEGVAALEADQLDDAERFFEEALRLSPEHREAQHYLEKVGERRSGASEELLISVGHESAPDDGAVERAIAIETPPAKTSPSPSPPPKPLRSPASRLAEPPDETPEAGRPRLALPSPKVLIWAGGSVLVLACAAIVLPRLFGGAGPEIEAQAPVKPSSTPARGVKSGRAGTGAGTEPARVLPAEPVETAKTVASSLASGRALMASSDFGGAVVAFNEALTLDPTNAEAKAGIDEAGERYKANKVEREALNNVKLAFRDGAFTSGLRLAYRLPPTVNKSYSDAVKVAGWYNLAIVALRAGECREAISHLDEALDIAPSESEAKKLREFASRYADSVKDRAFLDRVEALAFRPLPSS